MDRARRDRPARRFRGALTPCESEKDRDRDGAGQSQPCARDGRLQSRRADRGARSVDPGLRDRELRFCPLIDRVARLRGCRDPCAGSRGRPPGGSSSRHARLVKLTRSSGVSDRKAPHPRKRLMRSSVEGIFYVRWLSTPFSRTDQGLATPAIGMGRPRLRRREKSVEGVGADRQELNSLAAETPSRRMTM